MLKNTALLVIDVQKGIIEKSQPFYREQELLQNVNLLLDTAHEKGMTAFIIRHTNDSFLSLGDPAWQIHPAVKCLPDDIYINKSHSSVFDEKVFPPLLKERNISALILCGLVTNGCVKAAALAGLKLGYRVILAKDAHSTYAREAEKVVAEWNETLRDAGAEVVPTGQIVEMLLSAAD